MDSLWDLVAVALFLGALVGICYLVIVFTDWLLDRKEQDP